ncbi:MAG: phosphoribosylformylglycinamidine synthase [Firmicutes bacterium HGW-Firmicutes-21]|nr:MAG: phosphoribosylformylglycinamidine synthase [Firmicutes bacterium HGW-Firmicutes-21]
MVYRLYTEKIKDYAAEADSVLYDLKELLKIKNLDIVRVLNRYDVENISRELFDYCIGTVFSEPQLDTVLFSLPTDGARVLAVEYLPGQYDQRADSASQCIQIVSQGERPLVKSAKVYLFYGNLTDMDLIRIEKHIINPVESRKASLAENDTLIMKTEQPDTVETVEGFITMTDSELRNLLSEKGLAMDFDDLLFCRDYFKTESRNPTITEIRLIDTYWSDHCRHTTFTTHIDGVKIEDDMVAEGYKHYLSLREELGRTAPVTLMDIATIGARYLKSKGVLTRLDESDEINACTVKIDVDINDKNEEYLLLFKNETHNHPTEIEPFGGAATCIGGAIRDPLSGRSYVYQAMRVTGAADPLKPIKQTIKGKLPQRRIVTEAAHGYSSYGNQIGLATGLVDEIYHDGYAAKRMEIGAVLGAAPSKNVKRLKPTSGDIILLLGGRTGRDGCGGATGSSKSHTLESLERCGAEVQKGNAPEERKLQRLFRNPEAAGLIKKCNDFGAGGVSVAIGELADGLDIDLDSIPKKYDGLDGTELAISESQERMAVMLDKNDVERFLVLASEENIEAKRVATVTDTNRLRMSWKGKIIVDISREFLNSNGAPKHTGVIVEEAKTVESTTYNSFTEGMNAICGDLNICSKRGLAERFDSTIGAGSILIPFGGKYQLTPSQSMAAKIPVLDGETNTASMFAYGFNPYVSELNPYAGSYNAVVESVTKLICAGAGLDNCYLTFQEYFCRLGRAESRWGLPFAALLGALKAQTDLSVGAIGGKDSMSGSFEGLDVPPTLVSFAVSVTDARSIISPEFKKSGSRVVLLETKMNGGITDTESLKENLKTAQTLIKESRVLSAYTPTFGGIAAAVFKMCIGNKIGFIYSDISNTELFAYKCGSIILELAADEDIGFTLGYTTDKVVIDKDGDSISLEKALSIYEGKLESVFTCNIKRDIAAENIPLYKVAKHCSPAIKTARPKVVIPVFPGTNCEYDSARAFKRAGAEPIITVIKNLTGADITDSVEYVAGQISGAQIIFIPGGFSGGDEPDGSAKFITAFLRNPRIKEQVESLLNKRDGLIGGICNGFQALIKLGLVPFGEISEPSKASPTLGPNIIGRHQSRLVTTRVVSNKSPWFMLCEPGELLTAPVSHGEGRFICDEALVKRLIENGQIATQYATLTGVATNDIAYNPNGSLMAIEGITSPDGRVFGKMAHSERTGINLYKNVPHFMDNNKLFEGAVRYFK